MKLYHSCGTLGPIFVTFFEIERSEFRGGKVGLAMKKHPSLRACFVTHWEYEFTCMAER